MISQLQLHYLGQAGCALFLKVHLLPILPLYNESLLECLTYLLRTVRQDPVLASFCTTHPPPLSPRPVAGKLIRARAALIRPARRQHRHRSGASIKASRRPSRRSARLPCTGRAGPPHAFTLHASRFTLHAAPPGQGVASIPLPQSWRLTCLNDGQSRWSIVRCCTPHREHPCARRTNEQVSWMGLALSDSPPPTTHARPRISGAVNPQPVSGSALLLPV